MEIPTLGNISKMIIIFLATCSLKIDIDIGPILVEMWETIVILSRVAKEGKTWG